jgi:membrane-bound serine protease (ClpP class)
MLNPLVWSILLLMLGLGLVMLEIFVPSGGLLGVLATISVLVSIAMAFYHQGPRVGLGFALVAVIAVPATLGLAFKLLPQTPVGKQLLLQTPTEAEVLPDDEWRRQLRSLVGQVGKAKSLMLPSGAVEVAGMTVDALSEGLAIDPGTPVRVVSVHGPRVVVRPVGADEPTEPAAARPDDILSQSIDQLGLDPLSDPLA